MDWKRVLLAFVVGFIGLPLGASLGTNFSEAPARLEDPTSETDANPRLDDGFATLSLQAPAGTFVEFSVDWTIGQVSLVPLVFGSLELPDPDAGCAVTQQAVGWIVEPVGLYALGDCAQKVVFGWPIARSSLTCVVGAGMCDMGATGFRNGFIGFFDLICRDGFGVDLKIWPQTPSVRTMNCETNLFGEYPSSWDRWSGGVGAAPKAAGDSIVSSGLNWRIDL